MPPELLDTVILGDCIQEMQKLPAGCADMVFADPPYNLQLNGTLYRPNMTKVEGVHDGWDQFPGFAEYDHFTNEWLGAARHVLSDTGTIWVIGTYHNIYRVGAIMMDLGYWILNDFIWIKSNPMPNFRGKRFTNAQETLIWAKRSKGQRRYTFNNHAMKQYNEGKQARSDWDIPPLTKEEFPAALRRDWNIPLPTKEEFRATRRRDWAMPVCTGNERLTLNGEKVHSTQKPEALLERVIVASTKLGDVVLDPFFGTGTTGAVARRFGRQWIGIEMDEVYKETAERRISEVEPMPRHKLEDMEKLDTPEKRIPFKTLLDNGLLRAGDILRHKNLDVEATVQADGTICSGKHSGSIHFVGAKVANLTACNGWMYWLYEMQPGDWRLLDELRDALRQD